MDLRLGQERLISSLAFDVFLHLGTLVALLAYFWRDWVRLVGAVRGQHPRAAHRSAMPTGGWAGC